MSLLLIDKYKHFYYIGKGDIKVFTTHKNHTKINNLKSGARLNALHRFGLFH